MPSKTLRRLQGKYATLPSVMNSRPHFRYIAGLDTQKSGESNGTHSVIVCQGIEVGLVCPQSKFCPCTVYVSSQCIFVRVSCAFSPFLGGSHGAV